jgi:hypothetical protein
MYSVGAQSEALLFSSFVFSTVLNASAAAPAFSESSAATLELLLLNQKQFEHTSTIAM